MSVYLAINEESPAMVASVAGWTEVIEWAQKNLNEDSGLLHLIEHGFSEKLPTVFQQLSEALRTFDGSSDVQKTLLELHELIENEDGLAMVTDGMVASDD